MNSSEMLRLFRKKRYLSGLCTLSAIATVFVVMSLFSSKKNPHQLSQKQPEADERVAAVSDNENPRAIHPPRAPAATRLPETGPQMQPISREVAAKEARDILTGLFRIDLSAGRIPEEQAKKISMEMKQLGTLGPGAIPVLKEFLASNVDLSFTEVEGGDRLDFSSIRVAMFAALKEIGGPEGISATMEVLTQTAEPREIALLARNLEQLAPGQFHGESIQAARESLNLAMQGQLPPETVAPLFQVFQNFGNADVISDLDKAMSQWGYYSAITLASLPDNAGIPALIQKIQTPETAQGPEANIALQVLAQISPTQPQAAEALVAKAGASEISDAAWPAIAAGLAGLEYHVGKPLGDSIKSTRIPKSALRYEAQNGTERLFSLPQTPSLLEEQINDRISVIDRLMSATAQPSAVDALRKARASLESKALAVAIPQ